MASERYTGNRNGWTVETSHAFLAMGMREMDIRYEQRFKSQELSVTTALASAEKAVAKAEAAAEKRFEGLNELRGMVNDILNKTMPRFEAESSFRRIDEKIVDNSSVAGKVHAELREFIVAIDKRVTSTQSERTGSADSRSNFRSNVALAAGVGGLLVTLLFWLTRLATIAPIVTGR